MSLPQNLVDAWREVAMRFGLLWTGTRVSGYGEDGPYHCEDCRYLRGRLAGEVVHADATHGECLHSIVKSDPEVRKCANGNGFVLIETGCCEFVDTSGIQRDNPLPR